MSLPRTAQKQHGGWKQLWVMLLRCVWSDQKGQRPGQAEVLYFHSDVVLNKPIGRIAATDLLSFVTAIPSRNGRSFILTSVAPSLLCAHGSATQRKKKRSDEVQDEGRATANVYRSSTTRKRGGPCVSGVRTAAHQSSVSEALNDLFIFLLF